ncbi:MAG: DUF5688 family protein [Anaerovoracaceae bacterium]|jgi:hypothetical protein
MREKDFMEMAKQEILRQLPEDVRAGLSLKEVEVVKINDQKNHGFCFQKEDSKVSPTLYLDQAYELFCKGASLECLMGDVTRAYLESSGREVDASEPDLSFENVRDSLRLRLVETKRNREYLKDKPYLDVGNGLALICDIRVQKNENVNWCTVVNNGVMEANGYDKHELFQAAIRSAVKLDPPEMMDLQDVIFGEKDGKDLLSGTDVPIKDEVGVNESIYHVSSKSKQFGAAAFFYPGVKEQAAEVLGEGYTVLPSSLHEVLLVPDSSQIPARDIQNMVKEINRIQVEPKDVLSDNIYHFDNFQRKLSTVQLDRGKEAR